MLRLPVTFPEQYQPAIPVVEAALQHEHNNRYLNSDEVSTALHQIAETNPHQDRISARFESIYPDGKEGEQLPHLDAFILEPKDENGEVPKDLKTVVLPGNVHSNELVWGHTFTFLAKYFCDNPEKLRELGFRIIMFDAEPGSNKLNADEVFDENASILDLLKGSYRGGNPDWDYPNLAIGGEHKPKTLGAKVGMEIIRRWKPDLWISLHDSIMGGDFAFAANEYPGLWKPYLALREALGLQAGSQTEYPAELAGTYDGAPGIHRLPPTDLVYGGENDHSILYAASKGAEVAILTEVPRFTAKYPEIHGETLEREIIATDSLISSMIERSQSIVDRIHVGTLSGDSATMHENTVRLIGVWQDELRRWREPTGQPPTQEVLIKRLFWTGRMLGLATRLAEDISLPEAEPADELLQRVAAYIEGHVEGGAEDITVVPIKERLATQVGWLACGILFVNSKDAASASS